MHLLLLSPREGVGVSYPWEIDIEGCPLGRDFEHTRSPNYLTLREK